MRVNGAVKGQGNPNQSSIPARQRDGWSRRWLQIGLEGTGVAFRQPRQRPNIRGHAPSHYRCQHTHPQESDQVTLPFSIAA